MGKDYLKDEANVLRVQQHQLKNANNKISEIDNILQNIQKEQKSNDILLDSMLEDMEELLSTQDNIKSNEFSEIDTILFSLHIEKETSNSLRDVKLVEEIKTINFNENMSWEEYFDSIKDYAFFNNLDLKEDPFKHIMTKTQQVELQKRIKDEFSLKNAQCDKYDYMIAGTCGIICGLIDILFVGMPGDSKLGDFTDEQANKITEKFAEFLGWDRNKALEKGKNTKASAIGFLENGNGNFILNKDSWLYKILENLGLIDEKGKFKGFKINYDQASTNGRNGTGGLVENLLPKNHHLKSLGHSPDIIGLIFSIFNQFTSTSSFINEGKIITIDTQTFELSGNNFIAKIFCGFVNWFGHLMSDWTGSSGSRGRGSGVPIPFYNLFQMLDFGEFDYTDSNKKKTVKLTFAEVTTEVFNKGYEARHGMAMAIPVVINELLIRFVYTMKAHFYHQKDWKDSIPSENIPELRRMLLVGHGTLCIMDGADAAIRSGGEMVQFLLRTNLIAWVRFGHLSLKEVNAWWNEGKIDEEAIDKYLEEDLKQILNKNR